MERKIGVSLSWLGSLSWVGFNKVQRQSFFTFLSVKIYSLSFIFKIHVVLVWVGWYPLMEASVHESACCRSICSPYARSSFKSSVVIKKNGVAAGGTKTHYPWRSESAEMRKLMDTPDFGNLSRVRQIAQLLMRFVSMSISRL